MSGNTFPKSERLSGKKQIAHLHSSGQRVRDDMIGAIWLERDLLEGESPLAVVFSVPRRKFKRAVDRNLLKRRLREAFRLNKSALVDYLASHNKRLEIMFLYNAIEVRPFKEIEEKIQVHLMTFLPINE